MHAKHHQEVLGIYMQFSGATHTGKNITVAMIDTGIAGNQLSQVVAGWKIRVAHDGSIQPLPSLEDPLGRGTELARCLLDVAPQVHLIGVDIFNSQYKTNSELLAVGIGQALLCKPDVICVCVQSFNLEKRYLFDSVIAKAREHNVIVVACASTDKMSFPAHINGVVPVVSHPSCSEKYYQYDVQFWKEKPLSGGIYIADGHHNGKYLGAEVATARLAGEIACLRSVPSLQYAAATDIVDVLQQRAVLLFENMA